MNNNNNNDDDIEILNTSLEDDIEILDTSSDDDIEILNTNIKEEPVLATNNQSNKKTITLIITSIVIVAILILITVLKGKNAIYGTYVKENQTEDTIVLNKDSTCKIKFKSNKSSNLSYGDCTFEKDKDEITFNYKIFADSLSKNKGIPQKMIGTITGKKLTTDDGAVYTKK